MTTQPGRLRYILAGACGALVLGFCGTAAVASSGIDTDSNEVTDAPPTPELPSPSLNVPAGERSLIDAGAGLPNATTDTLDASALAEDLDDAGEVDDTATGPVSTPPETALRLPGVSEEDLPRFRRQMYRTDI